jgi:hypothetical protein
MHTLQIIPSYPFIWLNDLPGKIVICPTNPQIAFEKAANSININYSLRYTPMNSENVEAMDDQSILVKNNANHTYYVIK